MIVDLVGAPSVAFGDTSPNVASLLGEETVVSLLGRGWVSPPSGGSTGVAGEGGDPVVGAPNVASLLGEETVVSLLGRGRISPPSGGSTGVAGEGGVPLVGAPSVASLLGRGWVSPPCGGSTGVAGEGGVPLSAYGLAPSVALGDTSPNVASLLGEGTR